MSVLRRSEWRLLQREVQGDEGADEPVKVTIRAADVDLEYDEGRSDVSVRFRRDATDLCVGDVQLLASRDRILLMVRAGYGDDARWTVLLDERLPLSEVVLP